MPHLIVKGPNGRRSRVELSAKPVVLGRADHCDVVLRDDAEVSREHALVWLDPAGQVLVTDKGSKNGTRTEDGEVFRNATRPVRRNFVIGEHTIEIIGLTPATKEDQIVFAADTPTVGGDTHVFPSTRSLDLNKQRLTLLIGLTERIGGVFERKQLLEEALDACCDALKFERGLIVLKTKRGDTELPVARNVQRDESGAYRVSRTLINRALLHGERTIVNNPATDLAGNLSESLVRFPVQSALCVPIMNRDEILGVLYGDRITQGTTYQSEDVDFLAAIARQVGTGLANLKLFEEFVRGLQVKSQLEQAREIQRQLLPEHPLELGRTRIEGFNEPSSDVSGDYFDYFVCAPDKLGFIIADVTGHGLPSALLMANLQAAVRVAMPAESSLAALAARVNLLVCQNTAPHMFITAIIGTLNTQSGEIEYVSAGHPGPLLFGQNGRIESCDNNSLPLGIHEDESFTVHRITPDGLKAALFFTDGMSEAADPDGKIIGIPAVYEALCPSRPNTRELIRGACAIVKQHLGPRKNADDMTLLAIQLGG